MSNENLLAWMVALWISSIFMWVWSFCLHMRIKNLEDAKEVLPEQEEDNE